jgi:hypothetical protein
MKKTWFWNAQVQAYLLFDGDGWENPINERKWSNDCKLRAPRRHKTNTMHVSSVHEKGLSLSESFEHYPQAAAAHDLLSFIAGKLKKLCRRARWYGPLYIRLLLIVCTPVNAITTRLKLQNFPCCIQFGKNKGQITLLLTLFTTSTCEFFVLLISNEWPVLVTFRWIRRQMKDLKAVSALPKRIVCFDCCVTAKLGYNFREKSNIEK